MTKDSDALVLDTEKLRALAAAATPGPYDGRDYLVRAIRGDLAVPLLESRGVGYDHANDGPTVRDALGVVVFRKGSTDAKMSQAMSREQANVRLAAYLLNSVPAILAQADTIERQAAEIDRLREVLAVAGEAMADAFRDPQSLIDNHAAIQKFGDALARIQTKETSHDR